MATSRTFGITVLADFILNEGVDGVLDTLTQRAGVTAVALNPTVTAETETGSGSFQPPSDAGASPRIFDRPLWGKTSLWVRSGPSYHPDTSLFTNTPYQPRQANDLTEKHGHIVGDFIDAALDRGLEVYFQVSGQSAQGMTDEDRPRLPGGGMPERMADTGCLASEPIRNYLRGQVTNLLREYPHVTGFRPDWPEYPCYKLDEAFQDFSPQVSDWARTRGYAFDEIDAEVSAFYHYLHGSLTNDDLADFADADRGRMTQLALLRQYPAVFEWLRLKSDLSVDMLQHWRQIIDDATTSGTPKKLSANAFMPPLTMFTGFDLGRAARICDAVSPKLYTMHWTVMVEFWGRRLLEHNPDLDEALLVHALSNLFDLADEPQGSKLDDYRYPEPHEPHPVSASAQKRRIRQARQLARSATTGGDRHSAGMSKRSEGPSVTPLVHGYGPPDDVASRFELVADSEADGVWINRYGYLSDAKLDAVGAIWRRANDS